MYNCEIDFKSDDKLLTGKFWEAIWRNIAPQYIFKLNVFLRLIIQKCCSKSEKWLMIFKMGSEISFYCGHLEEVEDVILWHFSIVWVQRLNNRLAWEIKVDLNLTKIWISRGASEKWLDNWLTWKSLLKFGNNLNFTSLFW